MRNRKKKDKNSGVFPEFGFVNSRIKKIWKNSTCGIISVFEQNGSKKKGFSETLKEVKSMRSCLSDLRNRELKMYQSAILFS
jgi:hypothetical protein